MGWHQCLSTNARDLSFDLLKYHRTVQCFFATQWNVVGVSNVRAMMCTHTAGQRHWHYACAHRFVLTSLVTPSKLYPVSQAWITTGWLYGQLTPFSKYLEYWSDIDGHLLKTMEVKYTIKQISKAFSRKEHFLYHVKKENTNLAIKCKLWFWKMIQFTSKCNIQ